MPAKKRDIVANFFSKVDRKDHGNCWLWNGALRANGYGVFYVNRLPVYAHRWSYAYHKGSIPEGLVIDHLCHVRHCVNPEHLEIVTQKVNFLRSFSPAALNGQKTRCSKGHLYDKENTYYYPKSGKRKCRECNRIRMRERTIYKPHPNVQKTHCPQGHPYDEENTRYSNGRRHCKACGILRSKASQERKRNGQKLPSHEVKTHCSQGHLYDENNTFLNASGYQECRACRREQARKHYTHKNIPSKDNHYTESQWEALKARYNYTCLCCGRREPEISLTADRIVPGCKGGAYTIDNVQPLCISCNCKKHVKVIDFRGKNP